MSPTLALCPAAPGRCEWCEPPTPPPTPAPPQLVRRPSAVPRGVPALPPAALLALPSRHSPLDPEPSNPSLPAEPSTASWEVGPTAVGPRAATTDTLGTPCAAAIMDRRRTKSDSERCSIMRVVGVEGAEVRVAGEAGVDGVGLAPPAACTHRTCGRQGRGGR